VEREQAGLAPQADGELPRMPAFAEQPVDPHLGDAE
jgi:hypothetical protein